MHNFNLYAKYYNLFYADKQYGHETDYIYKLIQNHLPHAEKILDLGCGTGGHALEYAKKGLNVVGMDRSKQMITLANSALQKNDKINQNIKFINDDARSFQLDDNFDVVTSLFHVMSYQVHNSDIINVLKTVKKHLKPGGIFIFDYWYGPAVLTHRPEKRQKKIMDDDTEIIRKAVPKIISEQNCVEVSYNIQIKELSSCSINEINELHKMRYFFLPELLNFFYQSGLKPLACYEWLTEKSPDFDSWYAVHILQKEG